MLSNRMKVFTLALGLISILAACRQDDARVVESGAESGERVSSSAQRPAWQTTTLFDLRTDQGFSISQFADQVVVVEIMAGECNPCDRQHREIIDMLSEFDDEVVAVSISVQPGEDPNLLLEHLERLGVTWRIAVMGPDLVPLMVNEFGEEIFDVSETPVILIGPDGDTLLMDTGLKRAFEIEGQIRRLLP